MSGIIIVEENGKYGFAKEATFEEVIPCIYDMVYDFENGCATVAKDGKWGIINKTGKEIIPCEYDLVYRFRNGYTVEKDGKWGILDKTGKEIVPCTYSAEEIEKMLKETKSAKNKYELENA